MSDITPVAESGAVPGNLPVATRDTPPEVVPINHENGSFSSLKGEEIPQTTTTNRSIKEENSGNETKDAENTVIGTANPSRTSSTPSDVSSEHVEHLAQPEAVSSQDQYNPYIVSNTNTTFVSKDEHNTALKKMEDKNEELEMKKEIEKQENASLKEECKDLQLHRQSLQDDRTKRYSELKELSQENRNTHDKIQEMTSEKREYMRRNSELEYDLQMAHKKIEQLEKKDEENKHLIQKLILGDKENKTLIQKLTLRIEQLERFLPKPQ